jgi:murein DD-endopeptidase MepM/ murein hydrolase activator NlpD
MSDSQIPDEQPAQGEVIPPKPELPTTPRQRTGVFVKRASHTLGNVARGARTQWNETRDYLRSEDARYRLLVVTGRFTSHVSILLISVVAIVLAGLRLNATNAATGGRDIEARTGSLGRSPTVLVSANPGNPGNPGLQLSSSAGADGSIVIRDVAIDLPLPPGSPDAALAASPGAAARTVNRRADIVTHKVQPGEVIVTIAERYGLQPTTIVWANAAVEENPELLRVGQELTILPDDGVYYTIKSGDTLSAIAKRFRVEESDIINYPLNRLTGASTLIVGAQLVVPQGIKPDAPRAAAAPAPRRAPSASPQGVAGGGSPSGAFMWPTNGTITQGYYVFHRGLDIAAGLGTPIYASDGGYVSYAGWSNVGYGYMVKVNHGNGFETLYAHLSYYYVEAGQAVAKGQTLGLMGSTGNSTGPHLHYEIRYGGVPQNPYSYLP